MERDPAMVLDDVRNGYVSLEKAREFYGGGDRPSHHEGRRGHDKKLREELRSKRRGQTSFYPHLTRLKLTRPSGAATH